MLSSTRALWSIRHNARVGNLLFPGNLNEISLQLLSLFFGHLLMKKQNIKVEIKCCKYFRNCWLLLQTFRFSAFFFANFDLCKFACFLSFSALFFFPVFFILANSICQSIHFQLDILLKISFIHENVIIWFPLAFPKLNSLALKSSILIFNVI